MFRESLSKMFRIPKEWLSYFRLAVPKNFTGGPIFEKLYAFGVLYWLMVGLVDGCRSISPIPTGIKKEKDIPGSSED